MSGYIISGIQQVGIGVSNVQEAFAWYNKMFGMDIPVFEEAAEAKLMLPYTGGKPHSRHAILAINIKGGGGFEIWQYTSRTPQPPAFQVQLGDYGLYIAKMKCSNLHAAFNRLTTLGTAVLGPVTSDPAGRKHFYVKDLAGNIFELLEDDNFFSTGKGDIGGPCGMVIGVSDLQRSKKF